MRQICFIFFVLFLLGKFEPGKCQQQPAKTAFKKSAIHFEERIGWQDILAKAKKESKYIFLDCFTTWCGPCKNMDAEVYTDDSVGAFFNRNFISIKLQMDRSKADSEATKSRYKDAVCISKKYEITAYPTLLFLSPDGELVHRHEGFLKPSKFVLLATAAMEPGRKFVDPVKELREAIKSYQKRGEKLSDLKPLIDQAIAAKRKIMADSLSQVYLERLRSEEKNNLYKKEVLLFIGNSKLGFEDPLLSLFYPDGSKADAIVGSKGFSQFVVDRYIKKNYFSRDSVFKKDSMSVNWDSITSVIAKRFSVEYANRGRSAAQLRWYELRKREEQFKYGFIKLIDSFGISAVLIYDHLLGSSSRYEDGRKNSAIIVNAVCDDLILKKSDETAITDWGINCMRKLVQDGENDSTAWWNVYTFDTYACLLYKRGLIDQAICYENKALALLRADLNTPKDYINSYEATLLKMKEGAPLFSKTK
ncbi:thioredoxin family protein [Filimonas effusa]|uniref:Thioredoxin family protein n=1 Tax=Filimonas effusa TaxID=2508721 RepID=A0A4Q1D2X7_9BACT|nr:thioredoxin family protein [Filimonas effusa]RXK81752.1 thioredoxin family protein [Filimonas effusa]